MSDTTYTLLVVDDEPEILESLRRLLRSEHYKVLTTTSAIQALQMLEQQPVDILLSDIDMPGMNGLELVARVRKTRPEVIRMLLTGDASLGSALDAINRGEVHRYLTKPWNKTALRDTIQQALARVEEFRKQAAVERQAAQQRLLLRELEVAHPGISRVEYDNGVYLLDQDQLDRVIGLLPDTVTQAVFGVPGSAPTVDVTPTAVEMLPSKKP
jgi:two-component system probable response regulator PhcQ